MPNTSANIPSPEQINELIEQRQLRQLRQLMTDVHPSDIAELLNELDDETAVILFDLLPLPIASEVLDETNSLVRLTLVDQVDDERLADLLDELPMDDAAEILYDLPDPVSDRLLELMEPEEAEEVRELLSYEDETAGRLMTRDVVALRRFWTVSETFDFLRSLEDAETLAYLYVVDRDDKLLGVVPLRALIMSQPYETIENIMHPDIVAVSVTADQEELADMVARYDYYAMPVVDEQYRLLGIVTVDDVVDILEEEATEDIQRLGGSEPLQQPYFSTTLFQIVRKRIGWLLLLFVAGTLTSTVLRLFEGVLNQVLALSLFIPLITGTGGNAGSQTVATIIRAITLGEVRLANIGRAWWREVSAGFTVGIAMAGVGFLFALSLGVGGSVAIVVACTLPAVVIWSTTTATVIPILADRFNIDPTVISGPMISTIVDATGLMIYFSLAQLILPGV